MIGFIIGLICGFVMCYVLSFSFTSAYQKRLYELEFERSSEVLENSFLAKLMLYENLRIQYEQARGVLIMLQTLNDEGFDITEREHLQIRHVVENMQEWESPTSEELGLVEVIHEPD